MLRNPAGENNKQPILEVLQKYISPDVDSKLLEISSGPGLHASFFAKHFPKTIFQTSEYETGMFDSINAYRRNCGMNNVLEPVLIDIAKDVEVWDAKFGDKRIAECKQSFDYMLNINMMVSCANGIQAIIM